MTVREDSAGRRRGQQFGGVGYIVNPFDPLAIGLPAVRVFLLVTVDGTEVALEGPGRHLGGPA